MKPGTGLDLQRHWSPPCPEDNKQLIEEAFYSTTPSGMEKTTLQPLDGGFKSSFVLKVLVAVSYTGIRQGL